MIYKFITDNNDNYIVIVIGAPDSDEEPEDHDKDHDNGEKLHLWRKRNQETRRNKMLQAMLRLPTSDKRKYVPDEKDEELIRKMLISPLLKSSTKWTTYGKGEQQVVKDMVEQGIIPSTKNTNAKLAAFSRTAGHYSLYFKVFLGLYQENLIDNNMGDSLFNGKLQIWQFLDFKGPHYIPLPQSVKQLLDKMDGGNQKKFAFGGILQFLDSVYEWLSTPEGFQVFKSTRTTKQMDLSDAEMSAVAEDEIIRRKTLISQTKEYINLNKPYGVFQGEVNFDAQRRRVFSEEFEGVKIPDPVEVIPKYLNHKKTKEMYSKMEQWADQGYIPTKKQMADLSKNFIKTIMCKNSHRVEVYGSAFTRALFFKAKADGLAAFPYQQVTGSKLDINNPTVSNKIYSTMDDGQQFYAREFPHQRDPNDPDDIMAGAEPGASEEARQKWETFAGYTVKILLHKTGPRYPCWIYFSQIDFVSIIKRVSSRIYFKCIFQLDLLHFLSRGTDV